VKGGGACAGPRLEVPFVEWRRHLIFGWAAAAVECPNRQSRKVVRICMCFSLMEYSITRFFSAQLFGGTAVWLG
jgi:hypothetical protein